MVHPGLLSTVPPWHPGIKGDLVSLGDLAMMVLYTRDVGSGRVSLGTGGRPRVHYWPTEKDVDHILDVS